MITQAWSVREILSGGFLAIVSFVALKTIYNLFVHPLRSYPGRVFWRASALPKVYHSLRGDLHVQIKKMHDQHGHVVRIEPGQLTYTHPDAPQEIAGFTTKTTRVNFEKDPFHYKPFSISGATNILSANEADHRRLRRLQSHAFSEKALSAQEDILLSFTRQFIEQLRHRAESREHHGIVNMVTWYNFLTFDLIGDLAFGEPFGCLESGELNPWISTLFAGFNQFGVFIRASAVIPLLQPITKSLMPKHLKSARSLNVLWSAEKVKRRIATMTDRPDFLSYILKHNDTEKGMTPAELNEASAVFIFAGSETTATLLSGLTFHLLTSPGVLKTLCEEIRGTFKSPGQITMLSTAQLPYLRAVIEEALRIYPPAPNIFPRISPKGGAIVCGQFVPEGTSVAVHQYATHHSATNFLHPEEFHPERWMDAPEYIGDQRRCMQPFSVGPRNCIGKNLAYTEIRLAISHLLYEFDLELMSESRGWLDQKTFSLWQKPPLLVKLSIKAT